MQRLLVAATMVAAAVPFAPAAHAAPDPTGTVCGFVSVTDPDNAGFQVAEIDGGPLVLVDDTDPAVTYAGTLTCTIQTGGSNGWNYRHSDPDAASVTGSSGTVVTAAGVVTFPLGDDEELFVCAQVDLTNGSTLYWDHSNAAWSASPDVECKGVFSEPAPGPYSWDDLLCPPFAVAFPPEGDIAVPVLGKIWDCPPYDV